MDKLDKPNKFYTVNAYLDKNNNTNSLYFQIF